MLRRTLVSLAAVALLVVIGTAAEEPAKPKDTKAPIGLQKDVIDVQKTLERRFKDFEQKLLELAQRLEKSPKQEEREKAQILKDALKLASDQAIDVRFSQVIDTLKKSQANSLQEVKEAIAQAELLSKSLREVLDLLLTDSKEAQAKAERERIQNMLKELNRIIRDQKIVRAKTERGGMDPEQLAKNQQDVRGSTEQIARDLAGKGGESKAGEKAGEGKPDGKAKGEGKAGEGKPDTKDPKGEGKAGEGKSGQEGKSGEGKPDGKEGKPGEGKGEPKEGKGGEGKGEPKEGKGGEGKGEPKEGKGGEGKPGEGKGEPKEGKGGEGKPGEGKEGKPGEGKPGEGKEGKPGEGKPDAKAGQPGQKGDQKGDPKGKGEGKGEGKPGQGKPSEGKPGEAKGGEGKPSQGGEGQPKPGQQGQPGQSGQSGQKGQQPQGPQDDSRKKIEDAANNQKKAEEDIKAKNNPDASNQQDQAIQNLEEARRRLEEILKQLREEEIERLLAQLQARCEYMLQMQKEVYEGTVGVDRNIGENRDKKATRLDEQNSQKLADKEGLIVQEATKAIQLLEAEGSAVAFAEVFLQVREDMKNVKKRLEVTDVALFTQKIEKDIIQTLEEMIDALKKAQQDMKQQKAQQGQPGQPPPQGQQKLLELLAELKMVRSMQVRVNKRTEDYGKLYPGEQADDKEIKRELNELASRQDKIGKIVKDIAEEKNK